MNALNDSLERSSGSDLERVLEPLVNYICASDKPKTTIYSALATLCRQVDATNGMATLHFRSFVERH